MAVGVTPITDERTDRKSVFKLGGGIATYVADLDANKTALSGCQARDLIVRRGHRGTDVDRRGGEAAVARGGGQGLR